METEGKGFVVRDKRAFDDQGDPREEEKIEERQEQQASGSGEKGPEQPPPKEGAGPSREETERAGESSPLPEVNFSTLIMSLSSSALFHLGEIPDPQTGRKATDFPLAKHTIDTIGMLAEKTKGNLTEEEQKFLDTMLADLRWRYVKATG
jgi:hypothetical protein